MHVSTPATRAQIVQSLVWAEAFPNATGGSVGFADVQNHWSRPWISIAPLHYIAFGYPCELDPNELCDDQNRPYFRPNNNATRGQFAKMETKARGWLSITPTPTRSSERCGSPGPDAGGFNSFQDVCYRFLSAGVWVTNEFYTWAETVKAHNAIDGYLCGEDLEPCGETSYPYFRPGNNVTRGQMSKVIDKALTNDGFPHQACWTDDLPGK